MADRIAVMSEGRLEQYGSPTELYDRPANKFVAGFIGSPGMNFVSGKIDGSGTHLVNDAGIRLALSGHHTPDMPVTIGFRPEHITLADTGLGGQVDLVEPTGAEELITLLIPGGRVIASLRERNNLREGQNVALGIAPGHIHVFSDETGSRLEAQP